MDQAITRAAGAMPVTAPLAGAVPRSWAILLTGPKHGIVREAGHDFKCAEEHHERVQVMEIVEAGAPLAADVDITGLVRFDLGSAEVARPVGEFQGYVDGQPFVAWADRTRMPQVGDKLYAGAAPVAAQAGQVAVSELREALQAMQMAMLGYTHQNDVTRAALTKCADALAAPSAPAEAQQAPEGDRALLAELLAEYDRETRVYAAATGLSAPHDPLMDRIRTALAAPAQAKPLPAVQAYLAAELDPAEPVYKVADIKSAQSSTPGESQKGGAA